MRLPAAIILIFAAGCHHGAATTAPPGTDCVQSCPGDCEGGCRLCCGRHSKYSRCVDNLVTKHEARHLARAALDQMGPHPCDSCDFRLGFEQAFVDVAQGGWGDVPALPPPKYWKNWARTPEGHQRTQMWFAGYAAGSAQARAHYEPFNQVAASDMHDAPYPPGPASRGWQGAPVAPMTYPYPYAMEP